MVDWPIRLKDTSPHMAHHKVELEEAVAVTEAPADPPTTPERHPERRPGLERALWLIEYFRDAWNGPHGIDRTAEAVLDRLKLAIDAELENGGPLTTHVGDWR